MRCNVLGSAVRPRGCAPRVLSVGRLEGYKGFGDVLEALTSLQRAGALSESFAWVVVGDGPERLSLATRARQAGFAVSRGLDVLRGSYGGIVLAGVLGQLVALPLAAPIALGAGAVFGVRQVTDQRRKKVEQRRTSARKVVRAHLDETGARLGSAVRKAVQAAQRDVRDGVEALVADLEAGPSQGEDVSAEAGELLAAIRAEERDR